jgi:hypothetical protein
LAANTSSSAWALPGRIAGQVRRTLWLSPMGAPRRFARFGRSCRNTNVVMGGPSMRQYGAGWNRFFGSAGSLPCPPATKRPDPRRIAIPPQDRRPAPCWPWAVPPRRRSGGASSFRAMGRFGGSRLRRACFSYVVQDRRVTLSTLGRFTRRGFLKGAAAGAVAGGLPTFIPASALGSPGQPAPSNRLTLAHIGIGNQGPGRE